MRFCPTEDYLFKPCRAKVFGTDHHLVPFGQPGSEITVPGSKVDNPLACLVTLPPKRRGRVVALGLGRELRIRGAESGPALTWVTAA
jgi:hypothetical protein